MAADRSFPARVAFVLVVAVIAASSLATCSSSAPTTSEMGGQSTSWGGGDHATAVPTADGWAVTVVASGLTYHVTWSGATDGKPMLTFQTPDGKTYGPVAMDTSPDSAVGANLVAYYITLDAIAEAGPTPREFTSNNPNCHNHAGCDVLQDHIPSIDCSSMGACCGVHDTCINAKCTARGDSCSIFSLFSGSDSLACALCHIQVIGCFSTYPFGPGPNSCCFTPSWPEGSRPNACGEAQQCLNDQGQVVVDPAICAAAGIIPPALAGYICLDNGLSCSTNLDCCSGICSMCDNKCSSLAKAPDGSICSMDSECCSRFCVNGVCDSADSSNSSTSGGAGGSGAGGGSGSANSSASGSNASGAASSSSSSSGGSCSSCSGATPVCNPVTNTCVQCTIDTDCTGGNVCDTATNTCVQCNTQADCIAQTTMCRISTCTSSICGVSNAAQGNVCFDHGGTVCNGSGACVVCNVDADCSGGTVCDANTCVTTSSGSSSSSSASSSNSGSTGGMGGVGGGGTSTGVSSSSSTTSGVGGGTTSSSASSSSSTTGGAGGGATSSSVAGGAGGGPACLADGDACTAPSQCCGGECYFGQCGSAQDCTATCTDVYTRYDWITQPPQSDATVASLCGTELQNWNLFYDCMCGSTGPCAAYCSSTYCAGLGFDPPSINEACYYCWLGSIGGPGCSWELDNCEGI
jgi:hypothetical protein